MRQSHFEGSQKNTHEPVTRTEEGHVQANAHASSDIESANDGDDSPYISEYSERSSDDDGMFADEAELTVEEYIRGLSQEYNPERVLKYMSWQTRELTTIEREVVRFLRSISFGGGLSKAHTKEMLNYVRSLGGMDTFTTTSVYVCKYGLSICNVHLQCGLNKFIFH